MVKKWRNFDVDEEGENQETKGKTSEKKKLIVLAIISFLVVGIAVGITILLLSDRSDDNVDTIENVEALEDQSSDDELEDEVVKEDIAEEKGVVEDEKKRALYYEFKPAVLATFNQGKKVRYMQVTLSAMARDQAALDALDYHMPLIRSKINSLYSSQDFQFVQTEEGKLALQAETINVINALLLAEGEPSIEDVYFTNFVLQ